MPRFKGTQEIDGREIEVEYQKSWQFNFKFDEAKEKKNSQSIEVLKNTGIKFSKLKSSGIDPYIFG